MRPDDIDLVAWAIDMGERLSAIGFVKAAQELADMYDVDDEWPSIVLDNVLDAEYLTDYSR